MSKVTVTYKIKAKMRKPEKKPDLPSPVEKSGTRPVRRAARMLALAHYVERLVESGQMKGYTEPARQLGITRARMSQVMNMLNLSPRMQESILLGKAHVNERRVRRIAAEPEWSDNIC